MVVLVIAAQATQDGRQVPYGTEWATGLLCPVLQAAGSGQKSGTPWRGQSVLVCWVCWGCCECSTVCVRPDRQMQRAGAPRADRSARPLGLPRSLGRISIQAPFLFSGPQMARTHLATARSSQLAARVGTQHAATRARSQPTVLQHQEEEAPVPRSSPRLRVPSRPPPGFWFEHCHHSISPGQGPLSH